MRSLNSVKFYPKLKSFRPFKQSGAAKLTIVIFGALIATTLYCAYHILPFFYYFYELENQFRTVIGVASTHTDQEIRQKLMYHIKKMEIPMDPQDLKIRREGNMMRISLPYEEVFYVTWKDKEYDIYTFKFHADVEQPFEGVR